MKKLLALVLALVMTLSLCVVSSNAAYADAADVDYTEAVNVMSAVGVFQGSDGKFAPKENLTREQAAKLIAYLDLGEDTAEALPAIKVFNDVEASRWSAKYVAYCADAGYINGVGNGNFDPAGELTGYAFGKMLLCVLGYDAQIEGFTGSNWAINVAKLLSDAGIDSVDKAGSLALTREEAAQYCLDALEASMVKYDTKGTTVSVGGTAQVTVGASTAEAVAQNGESYRNAIKDATTIQLGERRYTGKLVRTTPGDTFGNDATNWTWKAKDLGTYADTPDYTFTGKVTYGNLYAKLGSTVANNMGNVNIYVDGYHAVQGVNGTYATAPGTFDPTNIAKDSKTAFGYDGDGVANTTTTDDTFPTGGSAVTNVFYSYDSTDKKYDVTFTVTNTYLAKATADYNSTKENITINVYNNGTNTTTLSADDYAEIKTMKKDNYFLVNLKWNGTTTYTVEKIMPVTVVSDVKVSAYALEDSVTAGGTTYSYNQRMGTNDAGTAQNTSTVLGYALYSAGYSLNSSTYDFYLDNAGRIVGVQLHTKGADLGQYVFVKDAAATGFNATAKLLFLDGSEKTVTVSKTAAAGGTDTSLTSGSTVATAGTAIANGELQANRFYTYVVNSDGTYTLRDLADTDSATAPTTGRQNTIAARGAGNNNITSSKVQPINTVSSSATNDTVVIANKSTYTGIKNTPNVVNSDVYYLLDTDSKYILAAYTAGTGTGGSTVNDFVYAFNAYEVSKDDKDVNYNIWQIVRDGEKTTLNASSTIPGTITAENGIKGGLFNIKSYTDGYADLGTEIGGSLAGRITKDAAAVTNLDASGLVSCMWFAAVANDFNVENGSLLVDASRNNYFVVDDDTQYFEIDADDKTSDALSEGGVNNLDVGIDYCVYVIAKSTTDNTAAYVYFVHA